MASPFLLLARSARGHRHLAGHVGAASSCRLAGPEISIAVQGVRHYASPPSSPRGRSIAELDDALRSLEQRFDALRRRVIKPNHDTEPNPDDDNKHNRKIRSTDPSPKWVPPDRGWFKINVAAVFIGDLGQAAVGVIIRDERGRVLRSACTCLTHCLSEEEAQLMACKEGLDLARGLPAGRYILETECAACVALTQCLACGAALTQPVEDGPSHLAKIRQDIVKLKNGFGEVRFAHIGGCQNSVAHALAQHGTRSERSTVWLFMSRVPKSLEHMVLAECNNVATD